MAILVQVKSPQTHRSHLQIFTHPPTPGVRLSGGLGRYAGFHPAVSLNFVILSPSSCFARGLCWGVAVGSWTSRIVRAERLKNGEKLYEKQYLSPRPPPKISLKHDLNWNKGKDQGSTVEHRPVGKIVQQSLGETLQLGSSKPTKFRKPIEDRTGQLVTQEIVGKSQGELSSSDRAGQPAKEEEKRVVKSHDRTGQLVEGRLHKVQEDGYLKNRDDADKFNLAMDDENIDFNISGVPNAMVKRSLKALAFIT